MQNNILNNDFKNWLARLVKNINKRKLKLQLVLIAKCLNSI